MSTPNRANQEGGARLLVVDDNPDNRDLLRRRLVRRGYSVTAVDGGRAALSEIEAKPYDLVLLDVMMPEMSGLEVLEILRKSYDKLELPVVMATAKAGSEDIVEAFRLGANDYATKPLDFAVVLARIESHLAVRKEVSAKQDDVEPPAPKPEASQPAPQSASEPAPEPEFAPDGLVANMQAGSILDGRYRIVRLIGEGGFAQVYEGVQLSTGQSVALKVLRGHRLEDSESSDIELARFDLEMKIISRTRHPAIVRLIDSGSIKTNPRSGTSIRSFPYIVMELLDGDTLDAKVRKHGPMAATLAVDLMLPVLHGVRQLHDQEVIHRDLKPSNIFCVNVGLGSYEPKVIDFGIAKRLCENAEQWTETAGVLGTPQYMAPEQVTAGKVDQRADQYALAIVLYVALTGRTPYTAATPLMVMQQVCDGELLRLNEVNKRIPEGLGVAVEKALANDPEARYADTLAFGQALLPFASAQGRQRWEQLEDARKADELRKEEGEAEDEQETSGHEDTDVHNNPLLQVTQMLVKAGSGDGDALENLMPIVYEELHRRAERIMRRERADHTLQATALVSEAYLRLVNLQRMNWKERGQFYAVAAMQMRRILVDHARAKGAQRRGEGERAGALDEESIGAFNYENDDVLVLDAALDKLREQNEEHAKIVELRFFGGLTVHEVAQTLGLSKRAIESRWTEIKGWLERQLSATTTWNRRNKS